MDNVTSDSDVSVGNSGSAGESVSKPTFRATKHKKDPFIDETRIRLVDRYKTSEASGDEWRYSYEMKLFWKGKLVATGRTGSMESAAASVALAVQGGYQLDKRWETNDELWKNLYSMADICCHPGCPEKSTRKYVFKKLYDKTCEYSKQNIPYRIAGSVEGHEFCDAHGQRGDCALDDANDNYVCIEGKDWNEVPVDPTKISK